jgi:hypothetical protein
MKEEQLARAMRWAEIRLTLNILPHSLCDLCGSAVNLN